MPQTLGQILSPHEDSFQAIPGKAGQHKQHQTHAADGAPEHPAVTIGQRGHREQGDRQATQLDSLVAVRIAEVTGRQIGKEIEGNRYGPPTRVIDGDRTRPR
jgi:hypothetical protein